MRRSLSRQPHKTVLIDELKDLLEEVGSDCGSETAAMVVELEELEEDQPNKLYGARKNPHSTQSTALR